MSALVGLRKESVRSVIVCKDREFKNWAVQMLTGAAFAADKFSVETLSEAIRRCKDDEKILNVVVHGQVFADTTSLVQNLTEFTSTCSRCKVLLCTGDYDSLELVEKLIELSTVHVASTPAKQADFNKAFHGKAGRTSSQDLLTGYYSQKPAKQTKQPGMTALEASAHLKETIEQFNAVAKDLTAVDTFLAITQRFNGLIGACPYFEANLGYAKLKQIAELIDAVGKHYAQQSAQKVNEEHFKFTKKGAVLCFGILKSLRDGEGLDQCTMKDCEKLLVDFEKFSEIENAERLDQDDVDALLAAHL